MKCEAFQRFTKTTESRPTKLLVWSLDKFGRVSYSWFAHWQALASWQECVNVLTVFLSYRLLIRNTPTTGTAIALTDYTFGAHTAPLSFCSSDADADGTGSVLCSTRPSFAAANEREIDFFRSGFGRRTAGCMGTNVGGSGDTGRSNTIHECQSVSKHTTRCPISP